MPANALALPFKNDSFEEILVSHFLEHLTYVEIMPGLLEWKRVLHPDGKFKICVPDFSIIAKNWNMCDMPKKISWWTPAAFGSQRGPGQEHHSPWYQDVLHHYLKVADFFDWKFWHDSRYDFWLWCEAYK